MKHFLSIIILCFSINVVFAQGLPKKSGGTSDVSPNEGNKIDFSQQEELQSDIQDVANNVAYKLMRCCSSYGGNNTHGEVNWSECYYSTLRNTYTVTMVAAWTGSISGASYWIKGRLKLKYYTNTNGEISETRTWEKIADSGGFSAGCGGNCSINE